MDAADTELAARTRVLRVRLKNFLSYRDATLELGDLVALVGPNASGKSNLVAAMDLLHGLATVGLPTALRRLGGFSQIRYRVDPPRANIQVRLEFSLGVHERESFYELELERATSSRYRVVERAEVYDGEASYTFEHRDGKFTENDRQPGPPGSFTTRHVNVPPGLSVVTVGLSFGTAIVENVLAGLQVVEIDPRRIADLQDVSSTQAFEPDGSNAASIFQELNSSVRAALVDELSAIVPAIADVRVQEFAERLTFVFAQKFAKRGGTQFLARQMSDGTLRALGILLALHQPCRPSLLVVEEPESAIHLGALQTLVDVLRQHSDTTQVLLTTHSADIVDTLDVDDLRVVWSEGGSSRVANVADHTKDTVRKGLITPGELLRVDSLDPADA